MRLIDADALNIDYYDDVETEDDEYTYAYVSKAQIDNAPTIDAVSEWIPCSEREPSESGTYLVTNRWKGEYSGDIYNDVDVASYEHGRWEIATGIITAWMPLPKSYGERKESE